MSKYKVYITIMLVLFLKTKDPEPLRLLGIDDITHKKGYSYDTVVYNQEIGNAIAVITGSTNKLFYELFSRCQS